MREEESPMPDETPGRQPEIAARESSVEPSAVWCETPLDTRLVVAGPDAADFVNNFCTAPVAQLALGGGCEGFFTDVRGRVIALAIILRTDGIEILANGGLGERLSAHLDRYHIREQVEILDRSEGLTCRAVIGPTAVAAVEKLSGSTIPQQPFGHCRVRLPSSAEGGVDLLAVRCDWAGDGLLLVDDENGAAAVDAALDALLPRAAAASWDVARIEQGTPLWRDIPDKTLPQELGRDARAISFTKGCYLGQETVARLDALGHVNRLLAGLVVEANQPPAEGGRVTAGEEEVGVVTSACQSQALGRPLALAILRRQALDTASPPLAVDGQPARVVPLPLVADAGGLP